MDQFTNILNYLKVNVLFSKPKLSGIGQLMDGDRLVDEASIELLESHAELLKKF